MWTLMLHNTALFSGPEQPSVVRKALQ